MKQKVNPLLSRLLLGCIYALGVFFIVASGGGDGSSTPDTSCRLEVSAIAPATNGSGDVWIGVYSDTAKEKFNSVARLSSGGAELDWIPVAAGNGNTINTIAITNTSLVYVGGDFSGGIFRLTSTGTADPNFVIGTGFDGPVTKITPMTDGSGRIYVSGYFNAYNGTVVSGLVRLFADGSLDNGFSAITADVNDVVLAAGSFPADYIYSGGSASVGNSSSWLVRWRGNGDKDDNSQLPNTLTPFTTNLGPIFAVTPSLDIVDTVYASGTIANRIVRLTNMGLVDLNFNVGTGFDDDVLKIVRADDATGDIYAVGGFTTYNGNAARGIARLQDTGAPAPLFDSGQGFVQADGSAAFEANASAAVSSLPANAFYVGGDFSFYNGTARNGIARLNSDGSLDMGFAVEITSTETECNNETIPGLD